MTPGVLVDIGNTRMKWGRVAEGAIASVSLPNDDMASWQLQFDKWPRAETWLIASVVPRATRRLSEWLAERGITAVVVDNSLFYDHVQSLKTPHDTRPFIGIDRILNSYAAHTLSQIEGAPHAAVVLSIGTAMTMDVVAADGVHHCGAILPGPALMAKSLNEYTALLPRVEVGRYLPQVVLGSDTAANIRLGITRAIVHTADGLIADWSDAATPFDIFLTGGDAVLFRDFLFTGNWREVRLEPTLALEGLRLLAERLP